MPGTEFDLGRLLQPIGEEAFFRDSWEKQSLHIPRGEPDYYRGLLSTADVDHVIAFTRPKFLDPAPFAPDAPRKKSFVQGWLAERPTNDAVQYPGVPELHRVYEDGRTVVVMTMQHRWPAAADGMDLDTVLERAAPTVCRVVEDGQSAALEWPGGRIAGPPRLAAAFRHVAAAGRFAIRDLPDGLGSDGKLVVHHY
jgi:hypothetical protein